jgi:hypothetical protein
LDERIENYCIVTKKSASKNNLKITNTFIYKITPTVNTLREVPSDSRGAKYAE